MTPGGCFPEGESLLLWTRQEEETNGGGVGVRLKGRIRTE